VILTNSIQEWPVSLADSHKPDLRNLNMYFFKNFFSTLMFLTKKRILNIFSTIFKSTISSLSKALSNCSNSSYRSPSILISSKRLKRDLQPTLQSLGQFLFTKINFFKFSDCKRHLLKLVRILAKEKILSFFFENQQSLKSNKQKTQLWETWLHVSLTIEGDH
jgi:hypothetical protein